MCTGLKQRIRVIAHWNNDVYGIYKCNHPSNYCGFYYTGYLYIYIRILMMMYVHTCSNTFNHVQLLVRNMFNGYRRTSSLFTKFVFVVWSSSCRMILYLHTILVNMYVISPTLFYLLMCLYEPYTLNGNISAGHEPMPSR